MGSSRTRLGDARMGYCPSCGAVTNAGATFCHSCGATLAVRSTPGAPTPSPPAPDQAPSPVASYAPVHPSQRVRPIGVTIIGFVTIAVGAFAILGGLFLILFMGALGAFFGALFGGSGAALGGFFGALGIFVAMFVFVFAAFAILVGVSTLRGRTWAWFAMLVLMGLNALGGLSSLATRDASGLITLLVSGLVIWYYFQPDVKTWFGRA